VATQKDADAKISESGREESRRRTGSLTIDSGWKQVAETALDFVRRFLPARSGD
jgi:hypothetical protein